jgi:hypothetical protein
MGEQIRSCEFPKISIYDLKDFEERFSKVKNDGDNLVYLSFEQNNSRVLPCWSRWLLPTIGYDGHLYPCCLVASKEFGRVRIADLKQTGFWESYSRNVTLDFKSAKCQCDRKAAEIHQAINAYLGERE